MSPRRRRRSWGWGGLPFGIYRRSTLDRVAARTWTKDAADAAVRVLAREDRTVSVYVMAWYEEHYVAAAFLGRWHFPSDR